MTYVNWRTCVIRGLRKRNPEQRKRKPRAVYWRSGQGTAGQHHFFPCFRYPKAQHICWRTFPTVEELCSRERSDTTRTCVEGFVSLSISFRWKGVVKSQKKTTQWNARVFYMFFVPSPSSLKFFIIHPGILPGSQLNFPGWPTRQQTFLGQPQPRALDERGGIWPDMRTVLLIFAAHCILFIYSSVGLLKARIVSMRCVCVCVHYRST